VLVNAGGHEASADLLFVKVVDSYLIWKWFLIFGEHIPVRCVRRICEFQQMDRPCGRRYLGGFAKS
jgi:hypothetical protein